MLDSRSQGDLAAHRVPHQIGFLNSEVLHQPGDIVGHGLDSQRAVDIGRASMGLQIDRDYLRPFDSAGMISLNIPVAPDTAVQQDQRFVRAVNFVVEVQARSPGA